MYYLPVYVFYSQRSQKKIPDALEVGFRLAVCRYMCLKVLERLRSRGNIKTPPSGFQNLFFFKKKNNYKIFSLCFSSPTIQNLESRISPIAKTMPIPWTALCTNCSCSWNIFISRMTHSPTNYVSFIHPRFLMYVALFR